MIIKPDTTMQQMDAPPSYEVSTAQAQPSPFQHPSHKPDSKSPPPPQTAQDSRRVMTANVAGPSMPSTTVYYYHNPQTDERVTSLLPPDHPEMVCMQQGHVGHTRFGILGVLAAVFWFPLGVGLCLLDRRTTCSRCGYRMDEGLCH